MNNNFIQVGVSNLIKGDVSHNMFNISSNNIDHNDLYFGKRYVESVQNQTTIVLMIRIYKSQIAQNK